MEFSQYRWTEHSLSGSTGTIRFRAWKDIPYVSMPVAPELQRLHIFIPSEYFSGGSINGYTAKTAPIFLPNAIGGYMEARPFCPEVGESGSFNTAAAALARGYVVISPGARGRTTQLNCRYVGKAPAAIVDLKAAVRFIRSISKFICGDPDRIISNGTSAGGALSALLGASGDSPLYQPYLDAMGAEKESDRIFAASCYCPITNLENSDTAYEWQFGHRPSNTTPGGSSVTANGRASRLSVNCLILRWPFPGSWLRFSQPILTAYCPTDCACALTAQALSWNTSKPSCWNPLPRHGSRASIFRRRVVWIWMPCRWIFPDTVAISPA